MADEPPRLSGDELARFLELLKDVDKVELKLTVPDSERSATATALNLDPLDGEIRQVFFFDTPDLVLEAAGVVVRARRIKPEGDSVVKLRPVVPAELPAELRRSPSFGTEVDAMPGGFVCSASMEGRANTTEVKEVAAGQRQLQKLFTKDQRQFYAAHAPEGLALNDLATLGPITVFKLKFTPPELGRRMVAEQWHYPDGSRILELSTKCAPTDAFQAAAETRSFLEQRGISLSGEQQAKTRTALEFFAKPLRKA